MTAFPESAPHEKANEQDGIYCIQNIDFNSSKHISQMKNHRVRTINEVSGIQEIWKLNKRDDALNTATVWKTVLKKHHQLTAVLLAN